MERPLLIIINGLPGSGKTTLAERLGADLQLPVYSRDALYETLYDALDCQTHGTPPLLGSAAFRLLYSVVGSLLATGQAVIVEQFFGRSALRTAEFLELQEVHDFEPFQIHCTADGGVLLARMLARLGSPERHVSHHDLEFIERNRERLLDGRLIPLDLDGKLVEIDTTTPESFDYAGLLKQIHSALKAL